MCAVSNLSRRHMLKLWKTGCDQILAKQLRYMKYLNELPMLSCMASLQKTFCQHFKVPAFSLTTGICSMKQTFRQPQLLIEIFQRSWREMIQFLLNNYQLPSQNPVLLQHRFPSQKQILLQHQPDSQNQVLQ